MDEYLRDCRVRVDTSHKEKIKWKHIKSKNFPVIRNHCKNECKPQIRKTFATVKPTKN